MTVSGKNSGSGMRPETKKRLKMFIKIQKRKEANFLRVSVDGKFLDLTQGHGEDVLPEKWNLRLNVERKENLSVEHWSKKEKLHKVRVRYIRRGVREKCSRYKYAEENSRCKTRG